MTLEAGPHWDTGHLALAVLMARTGQRSFTVKRSEINQLLMSTAVVVDEDVAGNLTVVLRGGFADTPNRPGITLM